MSGIEVAGIALAVFPILVNGLNQIVAGIDTMRNWKRYKIKLRDYADILQSAEVYLGDTLYELLSDIVHSDDELKLMLSDPGGAFWKQSYYERRLRERLDRSYTSYFKTIQRLVEALQSMCNRLGVNTAGGFKWDDYSVVEREMQRLKLTFSKSVYKELLGEIEKNNKNLREITHQNISLEPAKRQRRSRRPIAELKLIRQQAASLYRVFMSEKIWKCNCKAHHMASLRLEARPRKVEEVRADVTQQHKFRVLLSVADCPSREAGISRWEELEVIPFLSSEPAVDELPTRLVRFALNPHPLEQIKPAAITQEERTYIQDVCRTLCALDKSSVELGFLVDEENDRHQHKLLRADTRIEANASSKSLGELLTSSQRRAPGEGFSRRDRLQTAVTLASSVLQLDGTSWLKSEWSSDDIFFHLKKGLSRNMEFSHPYLSWQPCCKVENSSHEQENDLSNSLIRSNVLLALGLTLIELCFGRTLEEMRSSEDEDSTQAAVRFKTGIRLHRRVEIEMGVPYGEVVRRCLFQPFDVRDLRLDVEEVQQKILDDIVTPLVEGLNNFDGVLKIR